MVFIRKIKKKSGIYLAKVESYRVDGKVKQKVIKYIGKDIGGKVVRNIRTDHIVVDRVKRYLDVVVVDKIAEELELKKILGEKSKFILTFVYSHLTERPSIKKMEEWLQNTEILDILKIKNISTKNLYETLSFVDTEMNFEKIESQIFKKFDEIESNDKAVVIDITDTYLNGSKIKSKARRGKDGKYKKLIQIALAVTLKHGFPIFHKTYGGNISNIKIFKDMMAELRSRGFKSIIVDRGAYSDENIKALIELGIVGIVGVKKTEFFKKNFLSKISRNEIYSKKNRVNLKNTSVYIQSFDYFDGKVICVYNPQMEMLKREIYYEKGGNDDEVSKYLGYSLIFHNTKLDDSDVVSRYFDKDVVEKSFKKIKGVLSLRPIRVWLLEHIKGHIKICYLSYTILSMLHYKLKKLGISGPEAIEILKTGYKVHMRDKKTDFSWDSVVTLKKDQEEILKIVGCSV